MRMRVLAVDYGERRTGLAISDDFGFTAQGLDTIIVRTEDEILRRVAEVARDRGAERIVVGLPLNMNGSESEKSQKVRVFGEALARETSLPVVFWDERMTSMQAHRIMHEMEKKTGRNKPLVDRISATLILQEYMKTLP
ncbi:MAG: Holliday junction resolvase RuvX [Candidatus Latescibacterota bacterium]